MIVLHDTDIWKYAYGFKYEDKDIEECLFFLEKHILQVNKLLNATESRFFLTRGIGRRKERYPDYKSGRSQVKPKHLPAIEEYLIQEWNAEVSSSDEADDAMMDIQGHT